MKGILHETRKLIIMYFSKKRHEVNRVIFELTGSLHLFSKRLIMARRTNLGELVYYIDFLLVCHIWPMDHIEMYIIELGDQEVPRFLSAFRKQFFCCVLL